MKINALYLAPALVLLLPPLPLRGTIKTHLFSHRHNEPIPITSMLTVWQNWADLLRAGLGTFLLAHGAIVSEIDGSTSSTTILLLIGTLSAIGVLLQTIRYPGTIQLVAPIFYLSGLTATFGDFTFGGFAVFAGWMVAFGGRQISYLLPVMVLARGGARFLVSGWSLTAALGCTLAASPLIVAFLLRLPLLYVSGGPKPSPETSR